MMADNAGRIATALLFALAVTVPACESPAHSREECVAHEFEGQVLENLFEPPIGGFDVWHNAIVPLPIRLRNESRLREVVEKIVAFLAGDPAGPISRRLPEQGAMEDEFGKERAADQRAVRAVDYWAVVLEELTGMNAGISLRDTHGERDRRIANLIDDVRDGWLSRSH